MVGLGNVDNTSDAAKPVSTAQLASLNEKEWVLATTAPLKKDTSFNLTGGIWTTTLSLDPTASITAPNLTATGYLVANTANVTSNLTVGGNLALTGYLAAKPYVSLRVTTGGGTPSTNPSGSTVTIGTPGLCVVVQNGFVTDAVVGRGTAGSTNAFLYTVTWTTPHPLGTAYVPNVCFYTGSTTTAAPLGVITAAVASSTAFTVWFRATVGSVSNVLVDGSFYVYTVP